MGAGGIIQQHAKALLPAVLDASVYGCLSTADKDRTEMIKLKLELSRTQDDVNFLLDKLNQVCRR